MDLFREIKTARFTVLLHLFVSYLCNNPTNSGAVALTHGTVDAILASNELVFINFYADWCRFSNLLTPIFNEAAEKVSLEFPNPGQVVMGKVDCDKESDVASRFHITKYPTLKVIRNGQPAKREYRGARTVDAFVEFVKKQLEDPIKEFLDLSELKNLDSKRRIIIGFFERKDVPEYTTFRRVATNLKDDCQFHVGFGDVVKSELMDGTLAKIAYRPDETSFQEVEVYKGHILNYTEMLMWATRCCIPLVREITFENAEELTEEGLPLLILFHKPDDKTSVRVYKAACEEIKAERSRVNLLHGDGVLFSHPLLFLGKTVSDLPILALDSFRHMYLFPDMAKLDDPDTLEAFIEDLYSGKLHRDFHFEPEEVVPDTTQDKVDPTVKTSVPESMFRKLQPSKKRYTLLRDEL